MKLRSHIIAALLLTVFIIGCEDQGDPVTPPTTPGSTEVKFSSDIQPLLSSKGCVGCHGGSGGLTVTTVASLLTGGNNGPAIVPGNADSSNIVLKLRATPPFGQRMPQGGPFLSADEIKKFEDWINAGAKNN